MSNALLSLAAGFGGGYLQAKQRAEDQVRLDQDRAMRQQVHDAQMDEVNQAKDLRISLSNAAGPLKMTEIVDVDPTNPTAPRKTSFTLADGRTVQTREEADKAVKEWSAPEAQTSRIANVYRSKGAVDKAITLENSAVDRKRSDEKYTQEQTDRAAKLHQEGVFKALQAFRSGDASGLAKAFNAGGEYKLDGEPVITKEDREIPGIGKVPTYSAKLRIVGPDGQVQEKAYNSHDLSMSLLPFEKALEFQGKLSKDAADTTYKAGMLGAAQTSAQAAMIRAQRAGQGEGGGTKAPSGYRYAADGKTLEPIPGGPADKGGLGGGKALPATALKMQGEALDAIGAAAGIQGQISTIQQQIKDGKLNFGAMSNTVNDLRNATGISSEESKNFASFKATLEKMRNDSLRLNSGVQTDGDAQRAWNELVTNINDKGVVEQRLAEIAKLNERAETLQKARVEQIRNNYGAAPMDLENIASPPKTRQNAVAPTPVKSKADIDKLPSGAVFVGPDGKQRIKP